MRVKVCYLTLSLICCMILFACDDNTSETEKEDWYITQKDIDEIEKEKPDPTGNITFSRSEFQGMKLYMHHCNRCHPAGGKGKGPSLVDKKMLPDFLIHFQVRNGLGDMPKFTKEKLPKENVKKIVLFIRLLREQHK